MGFGQVIELADARPHALAPDAAGADGNEALGYLITDGLPVGRRVPPGPDAVFLVIMTKEIKARTPITIAARVHRPIFLYDQCRS